MLIGGRCLLNIFDFTGGVYWKEVFKRRGCLKEDLRYSTSISLILPPSFCNACCCISSNSSCISYSPLSFHTACYVVWNSFLWRVQKLFESLSAVNEMHTFLSHENMYSKCLETRLQQKTKNFGNTQIFWR